MEVAAPEVSHDPSALLLAEPEPPDVDVVADVAVVVVEVLDVPSGLELPHALSTRPAAATSAATTAVFLLFISSPRWSLVLSEGTGQVRLVGEWIRRRYRG